MDADRHQELSDLFGQARQLSEPERQAFIDEAGGEDQELRAALIELLAADQEKTLPLHKKPQKLRRRKTQQVKKKLAMMQTRQQHLWIIR